MAPVVEVEETEGKPHGAITHHAGSELAIDAATAAQHPAEIPEIVQRPSPRLESAGQLAVRLGLSFALLIGIMLGLGYWTSYRMIHTDLALQNALVRGTIKLQLGLEALRYSSQNSRITMQILVQKSATPELLARRAGNTERISELISTLEKQCDSDEERRLLLAVEQARTPYVDSYKRALRLLLEEKNPEMADDVMRQQATPALFAYHAAWQEFAAFELEQMEAAGRQSAQHDLMTRRIALALQWLAVLFAAVIAVYATRRMARDIKLRIRMQEEVSSLNAGLERRVAERTEALARTDKQLRESLAETQAYATEIEAVNELSNLLQSCLTLEEAHQQASWVLGKFFPAGAVLMFNASRNLLDVALNWGASSGKQGPFPPESCWALRKGQLHLAGPHCHNPVCGHYEETFPGCHLCIPMMAQGGSLGVLNIEDPSFCGGKPTSPLAQRKLKLAATLAEQISLALANLMLRETLKYQSVRDPLTGLFNRRHMEESLERELLRAARNASPLTVLMIDIDHFKRFNDVFGHEAGDLLLRELGSVLQSQIRGGDIACRYGGEEFVLIMAETNLEAGCQRAEILRQQISSLQVRHHDETLRRVTASIGIAGFPEHGNSAARIVRSADEALYQAKREGRDRVVMAAK